MSKPSTKLKEEFFKLLPSTIYFFVALHFVAFVRVLMLKETGNAPSSSISIAVVALILGKVECAASTGLSPVYIARKSYCQTHQWRATLENRTVHYEIA